MAEPHTVATWERLVRFHRLATGAMDEHLRERYGHSLDDYDVLHQIADQGAPIRMGDLAGHLLVANSSCHRIVGRLVEAGLVHRLPGEHDRREVLVDLTADGRRLHRRMAAAHTRDIDRLLGSRLSPSQRADLDAAVRRLLPPDPAP